jgi:hypothetical protein
MALCGIIKHHDKNEKPCVLGFWHFLTSESIAGLSASLSAKPSERNFRRLFSLLPDRSFKSFLRRKEYEEILYSINYSRL